MSVPVHRRPFDVFISHAHCDAVIVRSLVDWLKAAGLSVWFDDQEMPGGSLFGLGLHEEIKRCRGILVIVSQRAAASGWVRDECNVARDEQNRTGSAFRLVPLVIEDTDVGDFLPGVTALKAAAGALDAGLGQKLLMSQYPTQSWPPPKSSRDVYVSASWRVEDCQSAQLVCQALIKSEGFRLIGDSRDQYHAGFGQGDRVERIIRSCGALVAVIPSGTASRRPARAMPPTILSQGDRSSRATRPAGDGDCRSAGPPRRWRRFGLAAARHHLYVSILDRLSMQHGRVSQT